MFDISEFVLGTVWASIAIVLVVVGKFVSSIQMDQERIRRHIESAGGRVLFLKWKPFARGWRKWVGESDGHWVRYVRADGCERECYCKTHLFGGVYTADDRAISSSESISGGSNET